MVEILGELSLVASGDTLTATMPLDTPDNPVVSPKMSISSGSGDPVSRSYQNREANPKSSTSKVVSSIRDQAVEKYTALTRHKRELLRKNQKIQTKISQHLRKNKMDLTSNSGSVLTDEEEKQEYNRLLQELADLLVR